MEGYVTDGYTAGEVVWLLSLSYCEALEEDGRVPAAVGSRAAAAARGGVSSRTS